MLAIVLGPLAEPALRQSLIISNGSFSIFYERPMSAAIMAATVALLSLPLIKLVRDRIKA